MQGIALGFAKYCNALKMSQRQQQRQKCRQGPTLLHAEPILMDTSMQLLLDTLLLDTSMQLPSDTFLMDTSMQLPLDTF